jgi:hypothetical protein
MQRFRTFAMALLGIVLLLLMLGGVAWLVYQFTRLISSVPKELGAALVTAATTILVATATVMIGRYFERRKELDSLYRDKKTEIYDQFLQQFAGVFLNPSETNSNETNRDLVLFFREFTMKLVLWSGPDVIEAFVAWKDHLSKGVPDAQSIFLTEAFLRAIRSDLRHSNNGLSHGFFAKLFLKEGNLFLKLAARDPHLTLESFAKVEELMNSERRAE